MQIALKMALGAAMAGLAGCAAAATAGAYGLKPQVMPVVVQVNAHGKVTDIQPSQTLRPKARALLIKQIDAWITKPVMYKGHAVASSFLLDVALQAKPRKDGSYNVNYVYVKSMPMPFSGPVYWDHINGNFQLALVNGADSLPARTWRWVPPNVGPYNNGGMMAAATAPRAAVAGQPRATDQVARRVAPANHMLAPMPAMLPAPQPVTVSHTRAIPARR